MLKYLLEYFINIQAFDRESCQQIIRLLTHKYKYPLNRWTVELFNLIFCQLRGLLRFFLTQEGNWPSSPDHHHDGSSAYLRIHLEGNVAGNAPFGQGEYHLWSPVSKEKGSLIQWGLDTSTNERIVNCKGDFTGVTNAEQKSKWPSKTVGFSGYQIRITFKVLAKNVFILASYL